MSSLNPSLTAFVPQDAKIFTVRTGLVPGYVAVRLEPRLPYTVTSLGGATNIPYALAKCRLQVRNLSVYQTTQALIPDAFAADTNVVVVQFQECDDDTVSGVRYKLAAVSIQPGGTAKVDITPQRQFFEIKGVGGNGPVSVEVESLMDWNEVGFNQKLDPLFPPQAWQTEDMLLNNLPGPVQSAAQVFTSNTVWAVVHNLGYVATPTLISTTGTDITALAAISSVTVNGYTATFGTAQAGTAYSTQ